MEVLMPLFDLFKKPPKKDANQQKSNTAKPWMDNPLASPEMQKKRYDAAMEFLNAFQEKMPLVNGKPHPGTVFAIVARLAGTNLFRAVNGNKVFQPGTVILSEEINQAYPQLLNLFALYCKQNGVDVMSRSLVSTFPENDKPLLTVEQVFQEYQDQYHAIMKKHGLDHLESARAGMVVCSIIFTYHCIRSKDIDPNVATGIVAMGVVEGAKTAPAPLKSDSATAAGNSLQKDQVAAILKSVVTSSVSGSGTRLVLGEAMDAMQEASSNGGKYILVHPAVAAQLQQQGIDPYYVYQTAMNIEIKLKIARIDFVKVDVDGLFDQWRGKPEKQMPIPARLILWLKNNAASNGYEQRGNSWVLK